MHADHRGITLRPHVLVYISVKPTVSHHARDATGSIHSTSLGVGNYGTALPDGNGLFRTPYVCRKRVLLLV